VYNRYIGRKVKKYFLNIIRNTFCGTYEYMSPEVVFKKNYNANIDVWSLGILLFEMITGNTPFVGSSNEEIMLNIKYK
jgi:serine/threonine protein kinase